MTSRSVRAKLWSWLSLWRLRRAGARFPLAAPTGGLGDRVLIGPANSAGQGWAWARALEQASGDIRAVSMQFVHDDDIFGYQIDQPVLSGFGAHSGRWQDQQLRALSGYDAVFVESALPVLGGLANGNPVKQIEALRAAGTRIALLFHGSDLRDPDMHLASEPDSYFSVDSEFTEMMRLRTQQSRAVIAATGAPVFVSTPDLLSEVHGARWLPVVIDWESWSGDPAEEILLPTRTPVVVHAPSSSHIKGTSLVTGVLEALDSAGVITYQRVSNVSHLQMRKIVQGADVVVDQFRGGSYGVAACEAMAAGKIVVSHVSETVRERTERLSGMALPIVEAQPATLEAVLRGLMADPTRSRKLAKLGREFTLRWHDGRHSGQVLLEWLRTPADGTTEEGSRT